jgi:DNA polymerase III epsilon subunit-like protein
MTTAHAATSRFPSRHPPASTGSAFTAIDFETANTYANSACAVGLVRVERGRVVDRAYHLIRPPFERFEFTYLHGIDWDGVRGDPRTNATPMGFGRSAVGSS